MKQRMILPSARPGQGESIVCGVLGSSHAHPDPDDALAAHGDDPAPDDGHSPGTKVKGMVTEATNNLTHARHLEHNHRQGVIKD